MLFLLVVQWGGPDENRKHSYGAPPLQLAQGAVLDQVHGRIWRHGLERGLCPLFAWRVTLMIGEALSGVCCGGHGRCDILGVAPGMSALWKCVR